ncbi:MAG: tyrosine-type recombinase/integrase [Chloroflexi bacterium]|nr:tyrosine-type recombinase/integrase [Chloroflexota bacterium]
MSDLSNPKDTNLNSGDLASALEKAGMVANHYARQNVFSDYLMRRSQNTRNRQRAALRVFCDFLASIGVTMDADRLQQEPASWNGITFGLVEAFKRWMLAEGYAIGTVNARLSTLRTYSKLAHKAGVIPQDEYLKIKDVAGFTRQEGQHVDEQRDTTRVTDESGRPNKKKTPVRLRPAQVAALKDQPQDSPQGRRDRLLMSLLLDHGLRCGEVAALEVSAIDLEDGMLTFFRPKVNKVQTHQLSQDTWEAAALYLEQDGMVQGSLLRRSVKGGRLVDSGMSERAITLRVRTLGEAVGIEGLSAHDCRHYWATDAARSGTDPFALQEAGGWNSLAMPRRYVENAEIANASLKQTTKRRSDS